MRGVPITGPIPAIVRSRRAGHLAYYFAGDFADQSTVSKAYRYRWLPKIKARLGAEHRDDQQAFHWRVYVPLMQHIIAEAEATSRARPET